MQLTLNHLQRYGTPFVTDKRLLDDGVIEVGVKDGPPLRYKGRGESMWTVPDTNSESIHGPGFFERDLADVVACLRQGRVCQFDASRALIATEIIFGAHESSRRRCHPPRPESAVPTEINIPYCYPRETRSPVPFFLPTAL